MQIVLVTATRYNLDKWLYNGLDQVGLASLIAYARSKIHDLDIRATATLDEAIALKPDAIGISSISENWQIACNFAHRIKQELAIPVIVGGVHISLLPDSLDINMDIGVLNEGEETLVDLIKLIQHGPITIRQLECINGICYHDNGKVKLSAPRPLIADLDTIPMLDRRELPFFNHGGFTHLVVSRGCPYNCTICSSRKLFPNFRSQSVERVIAEIRQAIYLYDAKEIMFFDDLLIADRRRLEELIAKIVSEGLHQGIRYLMLARANLIDDQLCQTLKQLAAVRVGVGCESYSDNVLTYYGKNTTAAINKTAIATLNRHKIECTACFVFGSPVETREELTATLMQLYDDFRHNRFVEIYWGLLKPYPGTKVCLDAEAKGYCHEKSGWGALVNRNYDWRVFANPNNGEAYINDQMTRIETVDILTEWFCKFSLEGRNWGKGYLESSDDCYRERMSRARFLVLRRIADGGSLQPGDMELFESAYGIRQTIIATNTNDFLTRLSDFPASTVDVIGHLPEFDIIAARLGQLDIKLSQDNYDTIERAYNMRIAGSMKEAAEVLMNHLRRDSEATEVWRELALTMEAIGAFSDARLCRDNASKLEASRIP